jgi:cell division protein FtsA
MNKNNFDIIFEFGSTKIRSSAFNRNENESNYHVVNNCFSNLHCNKLNFTNAEEIIEKNILYLEKKTGEYVDNINLMIDSPEALSIGLSLSKKIENKKIKKLEIEYLVQDAKQSILRSYPKQNIIHILITNYKIDNVNYNFLPQEINCNLLSIDIMFICFPKKLIVSLEELFQKYNISINNFLFSTYAKSINYIEQLKFFDNVAFIDIGYEKTSIVYYYQSNFNFFNIIPIGSHHITKDIAKVLNIDLFKSEQAKLKFDKDVEFLKENNLSFDLVKKIIFARIEEILEISTKFLKIKNVKLINSKLVLMGEGSLILDNNYKNEIIFSNDIDLLDESLNDICQSGLKVINGINKQEVVIIPKKVKKKGFFERLFHFFK